MSNERFAGRVVLAFLSICVVGVTACGTTRTGAKENGQAQAPKGSLESRLKGELGEPVAILPRGEDGLVAMSADGTRTRVLVNGQVDWVLVDNRSQVIWFGRPFEIHLLDLLADNPIPETIMRQPSGDDDSLSPGLWINYWDDTKGTSLYVGHPAYYRLNLDMSQATLEGSAGVWEPNETFAERVEQAWQTVEPGAKARIQELFLRGKGRNLYEAESSRVGSVDVPLDECESEEVCGQAWSLPGLPYWRVVTSYSCGDGCYFEWGIYDPQKKSFVDSKWAQYLTRATISADSKSLITEGNLVSIANDKVMIESRGQGGGWLGKSMFVK